MLHDGNNAMIMNGKADTFGYSFVVTKVETFNIDEEREPILLTIVSPWNQTDWNFSVAATTMLINYTIRVFVLL